MTGALGNGFDLVAFAESEMQPVKRAGHGYVVFCPFHNDVRNPSLYVTEKGAYCFACGKAYSTLALVARVRGISTGSAKDIVDNCIVRPAKKERTAYRVIRPSIEFVDMAAKMLRHNSVALRYLVEKRGIDLRTLEKYKIGVAVPPFGKYRIARITFPVFDCNNNVKTISYRMCPGFDYSIDKSDDKRYLTHSGTNMMPFNIGEVHKKDWVVYAGGQIDCLTLLSSGVPAVGSMGEGVFKKEWVELFSGVKVLILLDNDVAGYAGALKAASLIKNSKIIYWPKDAKEGHDINSAALDKNFGLSRVLEMIYGMGVS